MPAERPTAPKPAIPGLCAPAHSGLVKEVGAEGGSGLGQGGRIGSTVCSLVRCSVEWGQCPPPAPWDDGGAKEPPLLDGQTQQNSGGMVFPAEGLNEVLKMSSAITSFFLFLSPLLPSQYLAQTGLKLTTPMPWARESWDYMCATMLHYF